MILCSLSYPLKEIFVSVKSVYTTVLVQFVNNDLFNRISEKYKIFEKIKIIRENNNNKTRICAELFCDPSCQTKVSENAPTEEKKTLVTNPEIAITFNDKIVSYIEYEKHNALIKLCFYRERIDEGSEQADFFV